MRNRVIGRLDELLKGIPEELRNTEVIKRKIDDLEIKINDYDNEIKSLNVISHNKKNYIL